MLKKALCEDLEVNKYQCEVNVYDLLGGHYKYKYRNILFNPFTVQVEWSMEFNYIFSLSWWIKK